MCPVFRLTNHMALDYGCKTLISGGVDLVAIDLMRIDLVTPSHSRVGKSVDNESTLQSCQPSLCEQQSQHLGLGVLVQASDYLVHGGIENISCWQKSTGTYINECLFLWFYLG